MAETHGFEHLELAFFVDDAWVAGVRAAVFVVDAVDGFLGVRAKVVVVRHAVAIAVRILVGAAVRVSVAVAILRVVRALVLGITDAVVLWNTMDLGYLTIYAAKAVKEGQLKTGDTSLTAGRLGKVEVAGDNVLLGQPLTFTNANIDQFDF